MPGRQETREDKQRRGALIRRLRKGLKLTLQHVADEAKMSRAHLSNVEHGKRGASVQMLQAVFRALGVSANNFEPEALEELEETKTKGDRLLRHLGEPVVDLLLSMPARDARLLIRSATQIAKLESRHSTAKPRKSS